MSHRRLKTLIALLGVLLLSHVAAADSKKGCISGETFRQAAIEERFGILLGLSESETLRLMKKQGFLFGNGKDLVSIMKDDQKIFDKLYIVDEDAGAMRMWHSEFTVLGIKKGELAMIADTAASNFSEQEAGNIFDDIATFLSWRYSSEGSASVLPAKFRYSFVGPSQIFKTAHWESERTAADMFLIEAIGKPSMRRVVAAHYLRSSFPELKVP